MQYSRYFLDVIEIFYSLKKLFCFFKIIRTFTSSNNTKTKTMKKKDLGTLEEKVELKFFLSNPSWMYLDFIRFNKESEFISFLVRGLGVKGLIEKYGVELVSSEVKSFLKSKYNFSL